MIFGYSQQSLYVFISYTWGLRLPQANFLHTNEFTKHSTNSCSHRCFHSPMANQTPSITRLSFLRATHIMFVAHQNTHINCFIRIHCCPFIQKIAAFASERRNNWNLLRGCAGHLKYTPAMKLWAIAVLTPVWIIGKAASIKLRDMWETLKDRLVKT